MLIVYDDGGRIQQIHPGCDDKNLVETYRRHGMLAFLTIGQDVDFLTHFVVDEGEPFLARRPVADISVSSTTIAANGEEEVRITGAPVGATVRVFDGIDARHFVADGEVIVMVARDAATFSVQIDLWPYVTWSSEIVAR